MKAAAMARTAAIQAAETAGARLGMTPSAWRNGGAGVTIRWTVAETSLGPLLIAATDKGLCRVAFDEDWASLAARFPKAEPAAEPDAAPALPPTTSYPPLESPRR